MSSNRSPIAKGVGPTKTDDLKLIIDIGPTIESRLHGVSIFTFTQIAAMSPADLAAAVTGIVGLTAEHICNQDWIGKARELAAKTILPEPHRIEEARQQSPNSFQMATTKKGAEKIRKPAAHGLIKLVKYFVEISINQ